MTNRALRFRAVALATIAACVALRPGTATAQLGKLKKTATDAAKEKVGVKTDAPAASGSENFVITADRLTAVMTQMEVGMERAAKAAAAKAVTAEYNAKHKAFETCVQTQMKTMQMQAPSTAGLQKAAAMNKQTSSMAQRVQSAQQGKRNREYIALTDSMSIGSVRSALVMYALETKCPPAYMPPALVDDAAAKMDRMSQSDNGSREAAITPAQRAGMTTQQFGMVRERAALWALQQTNNAPADNNKYGVFTKDEQAVLEAQSARLKKWAPIFKESPSTWATWGDIKGW